MRWLLVVACMALACVTPPIQEVACARECAGCCTAEGACLESSTSSCGSGGASCVVCRALEVCVEGRCGAAPVVEFDAGVLLPGRSCERPIDVDEASARRLRLEAIEGASSCGAAASAVETRVTVSGPARVIVDVSPFDVEQSLSVELRRGCATSGRCEPSGPGERSLVIEDVTEPTTLHVRVLGSRPGEVTLLVRAVPFEAGSCSQPLALELSRGAGVVSLPARRVAASRTPCVGDAGVEVLSLRPLESDELSLSVRGDDAALDVRTGGCESSSLRCVASSVVAPLGVRPPAPLTGLLAHEAPALVRWVLAGRAPGDACAEPLQLGRLLAGGRLSRTDSVPLLADDLALSCGAVGAVDRFYVFTLADLATVHLSAHNADGPVPLALLEAVCGRAPLGCSSAGALRLESLAPRTYLVVVEGPGPITVTVEALSRPAVDVCSTAPPMLLPDDGGVYVVSGDTRRSNNDQDLSCGGAGPDDVFFFQSRTSLALKASVRGDGGAFAFGYDLRGACGSTGCLAVGQGGSLAVLLRQQAYLWLDGPASGGAYEAAFEAYKPPQGSGCEAPLTVDADGGSTIIRLDAARPMPNVEDRCGTSGGGDLYLAVNTNAYSNVEVKVGRDAGVRLFSVTAPHLLCQVQQTCQSSSVLRTRTVPIGDGGWLPLLVGVEGLPFDESVEVEVAAVNVPAGESCLNPIPVPVDAGVDGGWAVSVAGSLTGLTSDVSVFCSAVPDQLFLFRPPRPSRVTFRVRPLSPFVPRILVLNTCSSSSSPTCFAAADAGLSVAVQSQLQASHLVVVGAASGVPGPFVLEASVP